jgi:hypothetical protein
MKNRRDAETCITLLVASWLYSSAVAPADAGQAARAEWSVSALEMEGPATVLAEVAELGQASMANPLQ